MKIAPALLVFLLAAPVFAKARATSVEPSPTDSAQIRFSFHDAALEPSTYSLDIRQDGTGRYAATYTASADGTSAAPPVNRVIHVQGALVNKLFAAARKAHFFTTPCQSSRSHVAFTGTKTLAYSGPNGAGSCTFNYAKEPSVNKAANDLRAIAYTLSVGEQLSLDERYEPLSLDAGLISLRQAAKNGDALEIENIAPELASIAQDDNVLNRDRAWARALLASAASNR